MQRLELETSDIDQSEPFVLRCPPQRGGGGTIVKDHVNAILSDVETIDVRGWTCLAAAIEMGRNLVVEGECIPGEPAARPQ